MTLRLKFLACVTLIALAAMTFAFFAYGNARNPKISFVLTNHRARDQTTIAVDLHGQSRRLREPLASAGIYAWSRTGIVAYVSGKGLFVRVPGHPAKRIVPPSLGSCCELAWSPDGRQLAYRAGAVDIFVASPPRWRPRRVADGILEGWAGPRRIVFVWDGGELYTMNAGGGPRLRIGTVDDRFAWTPDGRTVASSRWRPRPARVCIRQPALQTRCVRMRGDTWAFSLVWSPGGDRLAFVTNGDQPGLWTVRRDGTKLRRLVSRSGLDDPLWSPDGSMLAFTYPRYTNYYAWSFVSADGGGVRLIPFPSNSNATWVLREHLRPFELDN